MSTKFKRFVLLAALPLTTWACQCAQPVSLGDEPEASESPLPQETPITEAEAAPTEAPEPNLVGDPLRLSDCVDSDGDRYGDGPKCLDADCDDSDPALGSHGTRGCFTGPAGAAGNGICRAGTQSCTGGILGPCEGEVLPDAEVCDGVDNDCDGEADDAVTRSCGDFAGVGVCIAGLQSCADGRFGACVGATAPQPERCDGLDNDCDGQLDENVTRYTRDRNDQSTDVILRPVDIILVVDNSGSMTDEIVSIQNNISDNFAALLANSGIDYRVIFLSKHGSVSSSQSICIRAPLSGNGSCAEPLAACPVNGERFFHYSVEIGTHDSLAQIISTYNAPDECGLAPTGWSGWLRPNAAKVFIEITDAGPSSGNPEHPNSWTADTFEGRLFALTPSLFGTAQARAYMFHTIAGLHENTPASSPWLPTDPLITERCNGNGGHVVDDGAEYQKLSMRTAGLRYPICEYQSFDSVFRTVATGIIERTQMACDFRLKGLPPGGSIDDLSLEWTSGAGDTTPLTRVANAAACNGESFYTSGLDITLCPGACTLWQNDSESQLDIVFSCGP